ncbi:MAG TPA: malto-oligosyltrehalose trehalohydrolase [Bryobacteraceae bacterium]|jgi:maltooligosyltrehalose trehalohydrolase|nr:malto-oligosyltrehalose trehalohydrolase [Bryobacteraceae bacterium]
MYTFRVWAPNAENLAVQIGPAAQANQAGYPMQKAERGWWSATVPDAGPGVEYRFAIDGGEALPDPRSEWQPQGIHGPSCIVDHGAFAWSDQHWQAPPLGAAIIYELHIGTFTRHGTFTAAIERLDYLRGLGVTHIELMPVNEFSGRAGWGYDGVDLFAPHHAYGSPDDLKALVDACHRKGLAVLLDVVYNHLGPVGNYLPRFGPYFNDTYHTPWGPAVNLDGAGSFEVRRFFRDNALMWLRDYHFDGLRLDAVHAFFDRSAIHFLEYLSEEVKRLAAETGRHLVLIAESDLNDPRVVTSREANGYGVDAQWSDDFHHALHTVLTGEQSGYYEGFGTIALLAKTLQHVFAFNGNYSDHRERVHGRPVNGLPGDRFLAYIQNHDQVGNRARGERLSHLVSIGNQKIAAALVLTAPYVPMLFQGEEFSASTPFLYFTQHEDPELGRSVSEGRRSEFRGFGWNPEDVPDPQDPSTFERSKLKWEEIDTGVHKEMLHWYRKLIDLRRRSTALKDSRLSEVRVTFDETAKWLIVQRGNLQIACNLASDRHALPMKGCPGPILCSEKDFSLRPGLIELPGESVAIIETTQRESISVSTRPDEPLGT